MLQGLNLFSDYDYVEQRYDVLGGIQAASVSDVIQLIVLPLGTFAEVGLALILKLRLGCYLLGVWPFQGTDH